MSVTVAVQTGDFNIGDEYRKLAGEDTAAGAVVFFVGQVRDLNLARAVKGLRLEHYPGMTEKALAAIGDEAKNRWEIISVRIVHRVGHLTLGDQIVFVGVTSPHRGQAFQAAEFLIDSLKTRAPLWKKEIVDDGEVWLEAQAKDEVTRRRWS